MHARHLFAGGLLLILTLAGCADASPSNESRAQDAASSSTAASSPAAATLEPYPSNLSIEHFSGMTLSGTSLTLGRVIETNGVYAKHFITYRSNGVLVSGTFSIPHGEGPFPLIIQNHGFIDPSVYTNGRGLKREQDYMARQGFAVLHSDYRGHAQSDAVDPTYRIYDNTIAYSIDVANAILAVREAALLAVDASNVGMIGHSMGGGVAQMIAVGKPDLVSAVVLYAPIHGEAWKNFERWRRDGPEGLPTLTAHHTFEEAPAFWNALSPKHYYDRITAPVLLFQGTRDISVPKEWADEIDADLRAAGADVTYVVYEGEGHEFGPQWGDFMRKTVAFFSEHVAD